MSASNVQKILNILSSDLSEKDMMKRIRKYPVEDCEEAKRIMLAGVTAAGEPDTDNSP